MSYESELKEPTNSFLQPMPIALLASVVLHLLVYKFGLPYFNFENNPTKREVSIVELTPEQQARLPRLYPEANIPSVRELPELENPSSNTPAPPFALPPSLTPGIGNLPNLPPIAIPLPPEFDIPPLPPLPNTNIKLPPVGDLSKLPPPPSLESFEPPVENKAKTPTPPVKPPSPPEAKPQPLAPPPKEKTEPEPKPEAKPKPSPQKIAVQRQQNLQQEISSLSSSLQKQSVPTTDEDARKNYVAWLNRVKAIAPENLEVTGTYPRDACIRKLEGTSIFGVVVNAKGEVVASDLLKGAEYSVFDLQGSKDLAKLNFNNDTNQPKPYRITLNYKYDSEICPSLTLPSLKREDKTTPKESEKSPQPEADKQPQPKNSQAPKPQPTSTESEAKSARPEGNSDSPGEIEKQNFQLEEPQTKTPANEPSLREKLRDVPLLPKDRLSSPEQAEPVSPNSNPTK